MDDNTGRCWNCRGTTWTTGGERRTDPTYGRNICTYCGEDFFGGPPARSIPAVAGGPTMEEAVKAAYAKGRADERAKAVAYLRRQEEGFLLKSRAMKRSIDYNRATYAAQLALEFRRWCED